MCLLNDGSPVCLFSLRTEFNHPKEKAWGLGKFSTMEQLEKEGAYHRVEDKIAFGALVFPLHWGRGPRRPSP